MDINALLAILLGGLGSLVLWLVLGPLMTGYGFKRLVRKAFEGDPKAQEVFFQVGGLFISWASTQQMKTGRKIKVATDEKDADGNAVLKEIDEVLTPVQMIAQTVGTYVIQKAKGSMGGTTTKMKNVLMESAAESGLGVSGAAANAAARGNFAPLLAEIVLPKVIDTLKKRKENTDSSGGL